MSHEFSDIHLKFAARGAGASAAPTFSYRAWQILRAETARAVRNAKGSTIRIDLHLRRREKRRAPIQSAQWYNRISQNRLKSLVHAYILRMD